MVYRITALASLAILLAALYWTVRLERADWLFSRGDAASLEAAARLAPGNAEYSIALAQAEPGRAAAILKEAAARNPPDSSLRLELGLAEEQAGDFSAAEADLLDAARLDTGFAPRWALSDFYFHRHDAAKFWPVTKAALDRSYGDVSAQFRNCWALTADPAAILERAIPARPAVLRKYLDFLTEEGRLDAAAPVAANVLAGADREAVPSLLNYCDRMLAKWRGEDALLVWNGLVARKLIAAPDFRDVSAGHGFDWQAWETEGIHLDRRPRGLTVRFSGKQAENVEILTRYVPLPAGPEGVLTVRYRVAGIAAESGLYVALRLADGHDLLMSRGLLPGGEGDADQNIPLEITANVSVAHLILGYRRLPGTVRIEGTLTLEKFELAPGDGR